MGCKYLRSILAVTGRSSSARGPTYLGPAHMACTGVLLNRPDSLWCPHPSHDGSRASTSTYIENGVDNSGGEPG
jgi:hypothetical protein